MYPGITFFLLPWFLVKNPNLVLAKQESGHVLDSISINIFKKSYYNSQQKKKWESSDGDQLHLTILSRTALTEDPSTRIPLRGSLYEDPSTRIPQRGSLYEDPSTRIPLRGSLYEDPSTRIPLRGSLYEDPSTRIPIRGSPLREDPLPALVSMNSLCAMKWVEFSMSYRILILDYTDLNRSFDPMHDFFVMNLCTFSLIRLNSVAEQFSINFRSEAFEYFCLVVLIPLQFAQFGFVPARFNHSCKCISSWRTQA